jgi:hypothetical protein
MGGKNGWLVCGLDVGFLFVAAVVLYQNWPLFRRDVMIGADHRAQLNVMFNSDVMFSRDRRQRLDFR